MKRREGNSNQRVTLWESNDVNVMEQKNLTQLSINISALESCYNSAARVTFVLCIKKRFRHESAKLMGSLLVLFLLNRKSIYLVIYSIDWSMTHLNDPGATIGLPTLSSLMRRARSSSATTLFNRSSSVAPV